MYSMTLGEFRSLTADMDDSVELRIAYQPNYPLQCSVGLVKLYGEGVSEVRQINRDIAYAAGFQGPLAGATPEEMAEAREALAEAEAKPVYLYLMEGGHQGYADRSLWDEGEE